MHDAPRQKLHELIIEYGRSLCDDPRRCEALLKDYCGQHKREIFVLISALKNRVADDLLKTSASVPQSLLLARLHKRLEEELAMTAEAAHWAVESWALALGVLDQPVPVVKPTAVPPPPKAPKPAMPPPGSQQRGVKKKWILAAVGIGVVGVLLLVQMQPQKPLIGGRYLDHGDGTVTDVQTRLQWMRCSLGQMWQDGTCSSDAKNYTWQQALDAASTLNRQEGYGGYRDWRVPTKEELLTLVYCSSGQPKTWNDTGKPCEDDYEQPAIYQSAFPNTPIVWYWSSSVYAYGPYPAFAWGVSFYGGLVSAGVKAGGHRVRLVRGGQ